ncbi:restriction endonuclease subunit S [Bacteroides stercoris]|uniref:restriction endonuclease subunit S n=1 Tax=Bacteroides stercoris TaxID=46506 RepID=UPI0022DFDF8B|nr:restriction endonuclease subunit S [Bacteroides stercoris]
MSQFIEMLFKKPITGKIGDLVDKKIFSVKKIHSMNDIIEYIDISSVERSNHSIVETTSYVVSNAPSRAQQCVRLDDILVSTVRPINRNIAVVNSDKNNLVASTGFCVLRPKLAFKEYLLAIVQSDKYTEAMIDKASGGLYPAVNNGDVLNYGIYIPDEEFAKKFSLIYQQADKSKFGDFKSQFIEMYHKTHNTQTLESVCAIISKGITPKYVDFSSVAVVNQACIQWDGQHLENIKYHNEEILFKKRTLQTGDVLLNATGTGTLGRCCVFNCPSNDNIYINDGHVIALATDKSILLPEVLKAYLSLNDTQAEIYRLYVTGSTNQVDIVFSDIKKMKVPVPDIDDQISFVKILNQADKSKSYVRIALKNLESILGYCIRQVA